MSESVSDLDVLAAKAEKLRQDVWDDVYTEVGQATGLDDSDEGALGEGPVVSPRVRVGGGAR